MIKNYRPGAIFVAVLYLVCFQLFLQTGRYGLIYAGNILFCISIAYACVVRQASDSMLSMPSLTASGIRLCFRASLLALGGCILVSGFNYYLSPYMGSHFTSAAGNKIALFAGVKNQRSFFTLMFANVFPVNLVCGSLVAFLTAGIINEKKYLKQSGALSYVKI